MELTDQSVQLDTKEQPETIELYEPAPIDIIETASEQISLVQPSELIVTDANEEGQNPYFDTSPDTTVISGVAALRGFTRVSLSWIESFVPEHHRHTEVWRSEINQVSSAVCVGDSRTQTFIDTVEPQTVYYYWLRPVSYMDEKGTFYASNEVPISSDEHAIRQFLELNGVWTSLDALADDLEAMRLALEARMDAGDIRVGDDLQYALIQKEIEINALLISITDTIRVANENSLALMETNIDALATSAQAQVTQTNSLIAQLNSEIGTRQSEITRIENVFATLDEAVATLTTRLDALVISDDWVSQAQFAAYQQAVANQFGALVSDTTTLRVDLNDEIANRSAEINIERLARVNETSALAQQITTIETSFQTLDAATNARITQELTSLTSADQALAQSITTLEADFDSDLATVNSRISNQDIVISNGLGAFAQSIMTLNADFDALDVSVSAQIQTEQTARSSADGALAQSITDLSAELTSDIGTAKAEAIDYTSARVGYCVIGGEISEHTDKDACELAAGTWTLLPLADALDLVSISFTQPDGSTVTGSVGTLFEVVATDVDTISARAFLGTNINGEVTGITITDSNGDSALGKITLLGDQVEIVNPNDKTPFLSYDATNDTGIFNGQLILNDGTKLDGLDDLNINVNSPFFYSLFNNDGSFPADATATADFQANFGRDPVDSDHLTYIASDGSTSTTKRFNGLNAWVAPALIVNGDIVTPGSITASKINVADLYGRNINLTHSIVVDSSGSFVRMSAAAGQEGFFASYNGEPYFVMGSNTQLINGKGLVPGSVKASALSQEVIDMILAAVGDGGGGTGGGGAGGFFDDEFFFKYQLVGARGNIVGINHGGNAIQVRLTGSCYWTTLSDATTSVTITVSRSPNAQNSWSTVGTVTANVISTHEPEKGYYINELVFDQSFAPSVISGAFDYRASVGPVSSHLSTNVNCVLSVFEESSGGTGGSADWANISNKPSPTITLSGDVTGSGTMNELGDVSISCTVSGGTGGVDDDWTTLGTPPVTTITGLDADKLDGNHASAFTKTTDNVAWSRITGAPAFLTSVSWSQVTGKPTFATVATSGDYNDLINKPAAQTVAWTDLTGTPQATGNFTASGDIISNGTYFTGDSKNIIRFNDGWVRLNPDGAFTSGVYCGSSVLRTDGELQVGSSGSAFRVTAAGAVTASGIISGAEVKQTSDRRVKSDLKVIENALDKVCRMTGYTYFRADINKASAGIIAQDQQKVLPESVHKNPDTGLLQVDTQGQVALIVEAIKEIRAELAVIKGLL